ncbi:MAG: AroM family protein [Bacillota bacterium]
MKELGLLTIGQTPRVDFVSEIKDILGKDVNIVQKGALDGLTSDDAQRFYPGEQDETLVTKMADGTTVKVADKYIIPRLQKKVDEFEEEGISVIYLACTGEFPSVTSRSMIVKPQRIMYNVVSAMAENLILGVMIPDKSQAAIIKRKWGGLAKDIKVVPAYPYGDINEITDASNELKCMDVGIVIMDCMGYTMAMKDIAASIISKPVINARSLTAKIIGDII